MCIDSSNFSFFDVFEIILGVHESCARELCKRVLLAVAEHGSGFDEVARCVRGESAEECGSGFFLGGVASAPGGVL